MKKQAALFVCAFLLLTTASFAQDQLIIRGGLVSSKPKVDPDQGDQSGRQGAYVALGFEANISDLLAFQPEIVYIQKGDKRSTTAFNITAQSESRINYLQVPLLLKVKVPADKLLAYFNAGPAVGFGLSGKQTLTVGNIENETDVEFGKDAGEYKSIDISAQFGGGIGYRIGKGAIIADVRYGLGLSNLSNANNSEYKNRALMVGLGFSLPL